MKVAVLLFLRQYQQRMEDGINPLLRKYSVTFKVKNSEAVSFIETKRNRTYDLLIYLLKASLLKIPIKSIPKSCSSISGAEKSR